MLWPQMEMHDAYLTLLNEAPSRQQLSETNIDVSVRGVAQASKSTTRRSRLCLNQQLDKADEFQWRYKAAEDGGRQTDIKQLHSWCLKCATV